MIRFVQRTARTVLTVLIVLTLMEIAWGPVPWPFIFVLGMISAIAWDIHMIDFED